MKKVIDSTLSDLHVINWSPVEGLRELLQNCVDAQQEYDVKIKVNWKDGAATIWDGGPGIEMKDLSFGYSQKTSGTIGIFGEGMKSGFIALLRAGRKVLIETGNIRIEPSLMMSENFGVTTLHYIIEDNCNMVGTKVTVTCEREELEQARKFFVVLRNDIRWLEYDRLSKPGGSIYVNGSLIHNLKNSLFSYHLGDEAKLLITRDRDAINIEDAKTYIANLLRGTLDEQVRIEFLENIMAPDKDYTLYETSLYISMYNEKDRKRWRDTWESLGYDDVVLSSDDSAIDHRAEELGYNVPQLLTWTEKDLLKTLGIPNAKTIIIEECEVGRLWERDELPKNELENLEWAEKMIQKYYTYTPKNVRIGTIFEGKNTVSLGLTDQSTGVITISRLSLTSKKKALHVLLHESVHQRYYHADYTAEFQDDLLEVAVRIILSEEM